MVTVSKTVTAQGAQVPRGSAEPRASRAPASLEEFLRQLQIDNTAPRTATGSRGSSGEPLRRIAHHTTFREHLPSILRHGIVPRCPLENPRWEGWERMHVPGSPYAAEAVYVFGNALETMCWAWRFGGNIILTVDVEGLKTEAPGLIREAGSSAFRVYERIGPERLIQARRRVHAGDWKVFDHRAELAAPPPSSSGASGNVVIMDNVEEGVTYRERSA